MSVVTLFMLYDILKISYYLPGDPKKNQKSVIYKFMKIGICRLYKKDKNGARFFIKELKCMDSIFYILDCNMAVFS